MDFPKTVLSAYDTCGDLRQAWRGAVETDDGCALLADTQRCALLGFVSVIEAPDLPILTERCAMLAEAFASYADAASAERREKCRYLLSLGAMGTALVVILLV